MEMVTKGNTIPPFFLLPSMSSFLKKPSFLKRDQPTRDKPISNSGANASTGKTVTVEPEPTPIKSGSKAYRAKKFLASRLAETDAGRSTIVKLFGRDGDALLRAVVASVEKSEGKAKAKEVL